jgi:heme/copper-type cytochrome/quinol oxidase subunit 2
MATFAVALFFWGVIAICLATRLAPLAWAAAVILCRALLWVVMWTTTIVCVVAYVPIHIVEKMRTHARRRRRPAALYISRIDTP